VITGPLNARARELAEQGAVFVTATVVRVEHPTSAKPGNMALVHGDGRMEGFVGGVCAQNSVRLYSLKAIERGEPLLLRILPEEPVSAKNAANVDSGSLQPAPTTAGVDGWDPGREVAQDDGSVTVQNPCLSGGAIEVFLEPFLPAPRMIVAGDTPIAAALLRLGPELGLEAVPGRGDDAGTPVPVAEDLALVVAAHGRDELAILQAALEAGVRYVGLVASRKRGAAVLDALREDGVPDELLERIDTPAGLDIGARSPAEVALSILASIIEVRRRGSASPATAAAAAAAAPVTAVDPICGMSVVVGPDALAVQRNGDTHYFCGEGCQRTFERLNPA
jgi:xanthine dehydrogenase accessory factor